MKPQGTPGTEEEDLIEFSTEDLQVAIVKMKNNKSPRTDTIQVEFFTNGGYDLYKYLHELLKEK
jgi:hypothetical protein